MKNNKEEDFVSRIQELIEEKKDVREIPKFQRYPGRPKLSELFSEKTIHNKSQRNRVIYKAYLEYGFTLKEIGDSVRIHYLTVSRIIKS